MAEGVGRAPGAGFCGPVAAEDATAGALCGLLAERGETLATLDTGLAGKLYRAPQDATARPDGRLQVQEVFARAVEVIEGELLNLGEIAPDAERQLFSYQAWQLGFRVPWLLYDGDPATRTDIDARLKLQERIALIRETAVRRADGDADRRDRLVVGALFVMAKETLPHPANGREQDLFRAIQAGAGKCTENSMLLYLAMRMSGLDAGFAFVHEDELGAQVFHVSAFAMVGGERRLVDPIPPYNSPSAQHRNAVGMPALSMMLVTNWNRYLKQQQGQEDSLAPADGWMLYDPTMLQPR